MVAGVVAAFATAILYSLSVVLQKRQAEQTTASGVRILAALARKPLWLLGILVQMIGFGCHFFALTKAPVMVVQPIIGAEIVFVVIFAGLVLHEHPGRREAIGMATAGAGVVVLLTTIGEEASMRRVGVGELALALGIVVGLVVGFLVLDARLHARNPDRSVASQAAFMGLAAGLGAGTSDAMNRLMGAWISPAAGWVPPAAMGISAAVLLLGFGFVGFVIAQNAYKSYRAATVVPCMFTVNLLVPVAFATFVFGQPLPAGAGYVAARLAAVALVLAGVWILATSEQVAATFAEV